MTVLPHRHTLFFSLYFESGQGSRVTQPLGGLEFHILLVFLCYSDSRSSYIEK